MNIIDNKWAECDGQIPDMVEVERKRRELEGEGEYAKFQPASDVQEEEQAAKAAAEGNQLRRGDSRE